MAAISDLENLINDFLKNNGDQVTPAELVGYFTLKTVEFKEMHRLNIQRMMTEQSNAKKKVPSSGKGH